MLMVLQIILFTFAAAAIIVLPYALFKNASNTKFKSEFMRDRRLAQERAGQQPTRILTKSNIRNLPPSVQRHLQANGWAYSLHLPYSLLSDHINLEQSGDNQVKGKISYGNTSVNGIFTFDEEEGLLSSFRSSDCTYFDFKGNSQQLDWSLHFEDYQVRRSVLFPNSIKAVWHDFDGEDFTYFTAKNFTSSLKTAGGIRSESLSRSEKKKYKQLLPWEAPTQK